MLGGRPVRTLGWKTGLTGKQECLPRPSRSLKRREKESGAVSILGRTVKAHGLGNLIKLVARDLFELLAFGF
jgi:hypothetical protein